MVKSVVIKLLKDDTLEIDVSVAVVIGTICDDGGVFRITSFAESLFILMPI